jgi:hypothetical protein
MPVTLSVQLIPLVFASFIVCFTRLSSKRVRLAFAIKSVECMNRYARFTSIWCPSLGCPLSLQYKGRHYSRVNSKFTCWSIFLKRWSIGIISSRLSYSISYYRRLRVVSTFHRCLSLDFVSQTAVDFPFPNELVSDEIIQKERPSKGPFSTT